MATDMIFRLFCVGYQNFMINFIKTGTRKKRGSYKNENSKGFTMKNVDQEKIKAEFAASPDLQAEFGGDVKAFVALKLAEAQGRVHISRPKGCQMMSVEQFNGEVRLEALTKQIAENEIEIVRVQAMQKKSVAENEARQYQAGVSCTP